MEIAYYHDPEAPVQPDQYAVEFEALLKLYNKRKPMSVLEIGTRHGGTFWQWVKYAQPGATILGIDLPDGQWNENGPIDYKALWRLASAKNACIMSLIGDSRHQLTVRAVRNMLPDIDWLFIDGDHSEVGVNSDYVCYGSLVRRGGVIAFHDILFDASHPDIEVYKLWNSVKPLTHRSEELTSAAGQYRMGIGVLYV